MTLFLSITKALIHTASTKFILQMGVSWPTLKHVDGVQVPSKNVDIWNKTVGQQKVEQVIKRV